MFHTHTVFHKHTRTHKMVIEQKLQLLPCAIFLVENVSTTKDDFGKISAKKCIYIKIHVVIVLAELVVRVCIFDKMHKSACRQIFIQWQE